MTFVAVRLLPSLWPHNERLHLKSEISDRVRISAFMQTSTAIIK